jgi:hypothetical protein
MQKNPLRIQAMVLIGFLVLQYLVGMYVNLFVPFPENATAGQLWEFAWGSPALAAHIIIAILILIGSIVLCIRAARRREKVWVWTSLIGLLAILAASFSGASFIPSQTDIYSYSMALTFLIAFCSYAWGVYASSRE